VGKWGGDPLPMRLGGLRERRKLPQCSGVRVKAPENFDL